MLSKSELYAIANTIDCKSEYESMFNFAKKFIINPGISKDESLKQLKLSINYFSNNSNSNSAKSMLGKTGNSGYDDIENWCKIMKKNNEIWELTLDDFCFVMGICARKCKVNNHEK